MGSDLIYAVAAVAAAGLSGLGMLFLAQSRVGSETAGKGTESTEKPASSAGDANPFCVTEDADVVARTEDGGAAEKHEPVCPRRLIASAVVLTLICAAVTAFMYFYYGDNLWSIWSSVLLCSVLWACAHADRKAMVIPNSVLLCGVGMRILLLCVEALFFPGGILYDLLGSVIAAAALFVLSLLCRFMSRGAVGLGDVKLLTVMGFFLGFPHIWNCLLISMLCSFFFSLFLLITKRATGKSEIPFAPVLLIGTVLSLFLTSI